MPNIWYDDIFIDYDFDTVSDAVKFIERTYPSAEEIDGLSYSDNGRLIEIIEDEKRELMTKEDYLESEGEAMRDAVACEDFI